MTDAQIVLLAALLLTITATSFLFYDHGYDRGQRAERCAHQCADELAMVHEARGRHPSGRTEPPSRLDILDGHNPPARSSAPSPPGKSERAGADVDPWMP